MSRGNEVRSAVRILAALLLGGCALEERLEVKNLQLADEVSGRCVPIRFALSHPDALPAEVLVEVDVDGSGKFRPATPATAQTGAQTLATADAPGGAEHTFVWNAESDAPRSQVSNVVVRVSASASDGDQATLSGRLRVANNVPTFSSRWALPLPESATGVAPADFNLDGRMDMAVTLYARTGNLLVLRLAPAGGLEVAQRLTLPEVPYAVASADFNGDQRPDVAAVAYSGTYFVFLSDAQGQLVQSEQRIAYGSFTGVATADFDGDRVADLALLNEYDGRIRVLNGVGNGTFTDGPTLQTRGKLFALALGDFNADGRVDVAASSNEQPFVTVLLNQGAGAFSAGTEHALSGLAEGLAVGDVDSDGWLDLVAAPRGRRQLDILRGTGAGAFTLTHWGLSEQSRAPALVDLNRDGRLDVLVTSPTQNVQLLLGAPSGGFASGLSLAPGGIIPHVGELDANGDGTPDVFVNDSFEKTLTVLLGRPPNAC